MRRATPSATRSSAARASAFYVRDVSVATGSVGAQLRPGAARALFGVPAETSWPAATRRSMRFGARRATQRSAGAADAAGSPEPGSPSARGPADPSASAAAQPPGNCIRRWPRRWPRLGERRRRSRALVAGQRLQPPALHRAVPRRRRASRPSSYAARAAASSACWRRTTAARALPWADIALEAGYSDQPHFNREFTADRRPDAAGLPPRCAGLATPRAAPRFNFVQDAAPGDPESRQTLHSERSLMAIHELFPYLCVRRHCQGGHRLLRRGLRRHREIPPDRAQRPHRPCRARLRRHDADAVATSIPSTASAAPQTLGATPVTIHLHVDDADAMVERAVEAGATLESRAAGPVLRRALGRRSRPLRPPLEHRPQHRGGVDRGDAAALHRDVRVRLRQPQLQTDHFSISFSAPIES